MMKNKENFLQILDALGDMVLVKGPKSKILWANKKFCEYYGMSAEQLKGLIDAPFVEPDQTQNFVRDDTYVFENGEILDIPEEPATRYDGEIRIFHTVKSPIFDNSGNVIMTVGISRDITDRIENEEKIKIERERSLYSAKMATLGEMAGGIAHEINTPLAAISMLAGTCEDILNDQSPDLEIIKKNITIIEETSKKIGKIISGLRAFSRDGKNDAFVATKAADIIEDTMAFSRERIANHDIELSVLNTCRDAVIDCRSTEISQVLLNLLNNAHDAILNSVEKKWIKLEIHIVNDKIEISITDSGLGISKENAEKIFTPFFTTKEPGKGTGLGLSISKSIIEAHKGSLYIDKQCANTRFVILLPLKFK